MSEENIRKEIKEYCIKHKISKEDFLSIIKEKLEKIC